MRIYPPINWITAEKLLKDHGRLVQLGHLLPEGLSDYLDTLLQRMKTTRDRSEFWDFICIINVYQCMLLDTGTQSQRRQLREDIMQEYRHAWRVGGSNRHKDSKLAHAKFVHRVLEQLGIHPKRLQEEAQELVDFFKTL